MAKRRQDELIDELISGYDGPDSFWGEDGIFSQLKKKIVERTLDAEMDNHLGYSKHDPSGKNSGNSRNGKCKKNVVIEILNRFKNHHIESFASQIAFYMLLSMKSSSTLNLQETVTVLLSLS